MTDNTIAFDGGPDDDTSYGFQIQPVYAIQSESKWNMIARGILPIMGFEPGVVIPPIGHEPRPDDGSTWGLGDSMFQFFFSPKSDGNVKWGIGPQVSLKTRSSDRQAGLRAGARAWLQWSLVAWATGRWVPSACSIGARTTTMLARCS